MFENTKDVLKPMQKTKHLINKNAQTIQKIKNIPQVKEQEKGEEEKNSRNSKDRMGRKREKLNVTHTKNNANTAYVIKGSSEGKGSQGSLRPWLWLPGWAAACAVL